MISHKYKYIFLPIPKNASSTIRKFLQAAGKWNKVIRVVEDTKIIMANLESFKLDKKCWDNYFKFSFVRNPYDRIISLYFFRLKKLAQKRKKLPVDPLDINDVQRGLCEFLQEYEIFGEKQIRGNVYQYDFITDINGNIVTDFIGKFENLEEDLRFVHKKLGLKNDFELPHANKTKHLHYRKYYNQDVKELVEKKFKKDIEFFGYEF